MSSLPGDILRQITVEGVSIREIIGRCRVSKQFNQAICSNLTFWQQLAREFLTDNMETIRELPLDILKRDLVNAERLDLGDIGTSAAADVPTLALFIQMGYEKIIKKALSIIDPDYNVVMEELLEAAVVWHQDDIIEMILAHSPWVKRRVIFPAAANGHLDLVERYLPDARQNDINGAAEDAIENEHDAIAERLIPLLDGEGYYSALRASIIANREDYFERLLPHIGPDDISAALVVTVMRDSPFFDRLLPLTNQYGQRTALQEAILNDKREYVNRLLPLIRDNQIVMDIVFTRVVTEVNPITLQELLPYVSNTAKAAVLDRLRNLSRVNSKYYDTMRTIERSFH